ncbi:hypothetical protein [Marinobacter sp. SS21]|uniref:hypothetical protein n=1 Tax=Marinobacter sp. SS21 TaxID=2979460 RepID=UPI00232F7CCF|nr:hypothetical protein [Marinobacter sp. SS21]MDC0664371.1 hypothetical protein [Marinobacter sp. SS21]
MGDSKSIADVERCLEQPSSYGACNSLEQFTAPNFESHLESFYTCLDSCIEDAQDGPQFFTPDKVGEDRVTFFITKLIKRSGFHVARDEVAGNPDLVLSWNGHKWIGEAKIYKGPAYLFEGWLQLTTRYSSGSGKQKTGGVLIYFYGDNAKGMLDDWRDKLTGEVEGIEFKDCHLNSLAFRSAHSHHKSGLPFFVRHSVALLKHEPEDKSGRAKKS